MWYHRELDSAARLLDNLFGFEEKLEDGFVIHLEKFDVSFEKGGFRGIRSFGGAAKFAGSGASPEGDEHCGVKGLH